MTREEEAERGLLYLQKLWNLWREHDGDEVAPGGVQISYVVACAFLAAKRALEEEGVKVEQRARETLAIVKGFPRPK
jgi:hypothetical protein